MGLCFLCDRSTCDAKIKDGEEFFEVVFTKTRRPDKIPSLKVEEPAPAKTYEVCESCGEKLLFSITTGADLPFERLKYDVKTNADLDPY